MDPSLLEREILNYEDDVTGDLGVTVSAAEVKDVIRQHENILAFLMDWESGAITMTRSEYVVLPATLMDVRGIYHGELRRKRESSHGNQGS